MGGVLKGVGKVFGMDADAISEASKKQAAATETASKSVEKANLEAARSSQMAQETQLAQAKAADQAADLLSQPVAQADVAAAPTRDEVDANTGARKKPRDAYSNASINI